MDKVVGHQQKSIALHIEGIDKIILSPLGDNYDAISSYNKMDLLMWKFDYPKVPLVLVRVKWDIECKIVVKGCAYDWTPHKVQLDELTTRLLTR